MESVLKVNSRCDRIISDQDGIGLLHVIQDINHKQDEKMQRTEAYV